MLLFDVFCCVIVFIEAGPSGWGLDEAFTEDVIMVFALPQPLPCELAQVPFSRFGATLLKFSLKTKKAAFLFFPAPLSQEGAITGDCRVSQAQIDARDLIGWSNVR